MELLFQVLAAIGGVGVIVLGLFKFLGNVWRDRLKERERRHTALSVQDEGQRYGLRRVQTDRFAQSQYEVYVTLWQALQTLALAVDALWHKATASNVWSLATELEMARESVRKWSLFVEDHHLDDLERIFEILYFFKTGKLAVYEIRSRDHLHTVDLAEVEQQIEANRALKEQFEALLDQLRVSFRERLGNLSIDKVVQKVLQQAKKRLAEMP